MNLNDVCNLLGITPEEAMERQKQKQEEARSAFKKMIDKPPSAGEILTSQDGNPSKVWESWKERDGQPFRVMYCQAKISGDSSGWFLHDEDYGLKCLIGIRDYDKITQRRRNDEIDYFVGSLRVLRRSDTGKSLICAVEESD